MTAVLSPETLGRCRAQVQPQLRAAVDRLDPATRDVTSYHLGWTEADGTPRAAGGGKAVRPTLALLSAELAGADCSVGLPGAVAVELVHNFSLLHDDVMDHDHERRHRRTVWSLWGVPCAILTGDALQGLAQEVVLDSGSPHAAAAARCLNAATAELIRGQVADLAFERRASITLDECFDMVAGKTGSLLGASCAIGAVLTGAPPELVAALDAHGRHLGTAFQLVDDLLGIWGDPATTGKPVLADLRARKKSLPVTRALAADGSAAAELGRWYATDPAGDTEPDLHRAADLVAATGARAWAEATAEEELDRAAAVLEDLPLPPEPHADLLELGRWLTRREC
ncbi:polyprenyl synthetase family protein [Modestobacter sp. VKM Ac-2983]|uniref:polyprenyl synthetase family protein n=1 Tax=Modestobacter sp. VKM Ac-2983 TaxID=3004137 RepID=UPI0022ABAD44|nr:polyprenyl synthetase family protein [Modestobacter sp. VKM Ac-2983]MCZ2805411.1 polyprenyl synthetase family protein [Modestobacter sp. VKM Ac-2983]